MSLDEIFFLQYVKLSSTLFILIHFSHRAVVYCDTLQFSAMVLAIVAVMILGTHDAGGVEKVFEIADEGDRLIFLK